MEGIVVGVDGSEGAARALRWAVEEGAVRRWPVTAVLSWTYLDQRHPEIGTPFAADYDEGHAAAALDVYLERALGTGAGDVRRLVVNDMAAPALLDAAEGAELLVVGARGLGGFKGLLVGSVSRVCVDRAPCPVAVVHLPEVQAKTPARIVVGTDGSEGAQAAVRWAAEEARARQGVLAVVHAWHLPPMGGYLDGAPQWDPGVIEEFAKQTLDESIAESHTAGLAHPVEPVLANDRASAAVLRAAADADLVVVGHRGIGRVAGFLLGSTSNRVVHHAPCPVVVVPHHH
jgi:nucleotide-binding universal stress UspA family protein